MLKQQVAGIIITFNTTAEFDQKVEEAHREHSKKVEFHLLEARKHKKIVKTLARLMAGKRDAIRPQASSLEIIGRAW